MKKISTKNKISAEEQFTKDILASMAKYQHQVLSESIKRGIQRKKMLSTSKSCPVMKCKV